MKLPQSLLDKTEWTIAGPMGPAVPEELLSYSVLAVDGGARQVKHADVWVGDEDSVKELPASGHIFKHPPEKSDSDLALALRLFPADKALRLHLWGFLGGRRDHELFNLGEVLRFLETRQGSEALFYEQEGRASFRLLSKGTWRFVRHGLFSLGALRETRVALAGECKYTLPQGSLVPPLSSLGLSNEGRGEITVQNDGPLFVYFPEEE